MSSEYNDRKNWRTQFRLIMDNKEKHHRRSIRLRNYDYSQPGAYFITICAYNRECMLGNVINGKMHFNEYSKIVETEWLKTAQMRHNIELDVHIIMPNHLHGILFIVDICGRGTMHRAPTNRNPKHESFGKPVSGSIPIIIRGFKSTVTKQINEMRHTPGAPVWQRNYYEHVIRNENELNRIREYIINNSLRWEYDRENPDGKPDKAEKKFWKEFIWEMKQ